MPIKPLAKYVQALTLPSRSSFLSPPDHVEGKGGIEIEYKNEHLNKAVRKFPYFGIILVVESWGKLPALVEKVARSNPAVDIS